MKFNYILMCLAAFSLHAHATFEYRKATEKDVPELLQLINKHAIEDRQNIVILPEKFREGSLKKAVATGRIFVACEQLKKEEEKSSISTPQIAASTRIVGYKKLFVLDDKAEKEDVLQKELCTDAKPVYSGHVRPDAQFIEQSSLVPSKNLFDFCIYNGADFTLKSHRGKGINKGLTETALNSVLKATQQAAQQNKLNYIAIVYGVTQANAGKKPGDRDDRTVSISKSVHQFAQKVGAEKQPLLNFRYDAEMPTFDPKSDECKPQARGVKGFGCVVAINVKQSQTKEAHA